MMENTASMVTALVSLGLAISFFRADPSSPTSRALALALAAVAVSIFGNIQLRVAVSAGDIPWWAGLTAVPDVVGFLAGFEWILRVRRTIPAGSLHTLTGDNLLRVAQALAVFYGLTSLLFPELRATQFISGLIRPMAIADPGFYLFAAPLELAILLGIFSIVLCLNRRPDTGERIRLIAFSIATPFIASGLVLPRAVAPITTVIGLMILLIGAMRYHVLQGRRGQFLSRFLSPQVAALVQQKGLRSAMQDDHLEVSIVCCDLRGFTPFAAATGSREVIALLREYYDSVGEAIARHDGTVKDYAGDGILILIGAPLPMPDHAQRAVEMARAVLARGRAVTAHWSRPDHALGIGCGVATGRVTVGVVGGRGRLEYAAVGHAVNLASRLCERAADGEILIDERTLALAGESLAGYSFEPREPMLLKGLSEQTPTFVLAAPS